MLKEYGFHRVLDNPKRFPQSSNRLTPFSPYLEHELVIEVEYLHLDSASFYALKQQYGSEEKILKAIKSIIIEKGKMQNPLPLQAESY